MSGIDRRTLLGAAGAGLVLAGCTSKSKKQHNMDIVGTCQLHGQSVTDKGPEVEGDTKTFTPDRICIIYLKFVANLIQARRTYIGTDGKLPTDPIIQNRILEELKRVSKWEAADLSKDRNDIHPIKLGGQRIIVIYVNNNQEYIRFAYRRGVALPQEQETYPHTIRFTQFSGDDPLNQDRRIRKNHAFFNMEKVILTGITADMESNEAMFLQYWDTDEYGDRLIVKESDEDTHYIYSMNIKLEMAMARSPTESVRWVPVIVDPDTGNMGAEP